MNSCECDFCKLYVAPYVRRITPQMVGDELPRWTHFADQAYLERKMKEKLKQENTKLISMLREICAEHCDEISNGAFSNDLQEWWKKL